MYIDDDARVRGKLCSTSCPPPASNLRSASFYLIPPTPPTTAKRPSSKDHRQTSVESAPPSVRVHAAPSTSLDLPSPSTADGQASPPLTPDFVDGPLPTSSSCSRRGGFRWTAAVSDATSETSDQPPSNWASFDLSLSDCPLRLPPSDTACDLTIASVDSPTALTSDSVAALSVDEFDPLSRASRSHSKYQTVYAKCRLIVS